MLILPAIDLYEGRAVRLLHGDYDKMTVYSEDPVAVARDFIAAGATEIHVVDLEGARDGTTPNLAVVGRIAALGARVEIGGGIRTMDVAHAYLSAGVSRVILGTAAVTDPAFLTAALREFGEAVAVGVDIRDGCVAIRGWTEVSELSAFDFCRRLDALGVRTLISTDISRDGAMRGANHELYRRLAETLSMRIIASGGVSSMEDVRRLSALGIYGAIVGRAYYEGAIDLPLAIREAL
ncbi:MAG: 1-(5-phosphoribosyl)-5-[Clostridia bacterium]|nr:1-(5-phosphoribosyl)-5-[(5-phosphoribosylamino)methylideneamino]imidazole-4-carboxamide isomerase [Clostridia bacterium]